METETRICLECSKVLKGRTDKKFCNDYCRNVHNNRLKTEEDVYVKQVVQILKKNRRILEDVLGEENMFKCPKVKLANKGFDFTYHTHQYINQKGNIYFFCFEYGLLPLENDWYLIVKKKERN